MYPFSFLAFLGRCIIIHGLLDSSHSKFFYTFRFNSNCPYYFQEHTLYRLTILPLKKCVYFILAYPILLHRSILSWCQRLQSCIYTHTFFRFAVFSKRIRVFALFVVFITLLQLPKHYLITAFVCIRYPWFIESFFQTSVGVFVRQTRTKALPLSATAFKRTLERIKPLRFFYKITTPRISLTLPIAKLQLLCPMSSQ